MTDEKTAPIIVIKKKRGHGGHHGGAWKVAYADFVTAMMALFIVLWLMSSSEQVKKAIGGYFNDPSGHGKQVGSTLAGSGESLTVSKTEMSQIKQKLEAALKESPQFQALKDHIQITVTGEGLRIELLESDKGIFFPSGQSSPSEFGNDLLKRLSAELGKMPNRVLIEGHTDAAPFVRQEYSNWELSADRANAARRLMQDNGLREDQVTQVRGFADQHLRNPADPKDPSNRRISVIVQYATFDQAVRKDQGKDRKEDGAKSGQKAEKTEKPQGPKAEPETKHGKLAAAKKPAVKAAEKEGSKAEPSNRKPATRKVRKARKELAAARE